MKKVVLYIFLTIFMVLPLKAQQSELEQAGMKFSHLLFYLEKLYVDTVDLNKVTQSAIVAALRELDPHSSYIPADEVEKASESINGNFEGIGIQFQIINDTVTISQTITGTPAEKSGLLPGDKITHVDSKNIAGVKIALKEVPKLVRGPKGSKVELTIVRRGVRKPLIVKVIRDKIPIYSIDAAYFVAPQIGYIKINSFSSTTTKEVNDAIAALKKEDELKGLIIDLQSNGGGVMNAAIDLVSHFIPKGEEVLFTEGLHSPRYFYYAGGGEKLLNIPLAVLINEHSASASEIVSGALQDWDRATIIGRRSYGKGLVQRPLTMRDGSEIRLTIARYFTPSGRNIQKPYNNGAESYFKDLQSRYQRGEFLHKDSIFFPDSLQYQTLIQHRTVYGGGGIFPDIFVPLDTTELTHYYNELFFKGVFYPTVNQYIDAHRAELTKSYSTFETFDSQYDVSDEQLAQIIEAATKEGVEYNEEQFLTSKEKIKLIYKAVIAQAIFGRQYFFRVINISNDALQVAINELNKNIK